MSDFTVHQLGNIVYICTMLLVALCLARGHRSGDINLWHVITTEKNGKVFTDGRKLFEAGAFFATFVTFYYFTVTDTMTEWYVLIFLGAWTGARWLRDREQRLNKKTGAADGTSG